MKIQFRSPNPTEIVRGLWIGGCPVITEIGTEVDLLCMCAKEYPPGLIGVQEEDNLPVLYYGFEDSPIAELDHNQLQNMAIRAKKVRAAGGVVAVSCLAGRNRSALVAALILMHEGMSTEDAILAVQHTSGGGWSNPRPRLTNQHFRDTLNRWILWGSETIRVDQFPQVASVALE